jgi:hypothetical protein
VKIATPRRVKTTISGKNLDKKFLKIVPFEREESSSYS